MPSLLGCNIDTNIEPTLNFYIDALGDERKALTFVIHNPISLTFSLEKRLKPRLEEATDAGMIIDSTYLRSIMVCTKEKWAKKMLKESKHTNQ